MPILVTRELALLLEATEVAASEAAIGAIKDSAPLSGATSFPAAGGRALFFGAGSPLSQALSLGLRGPVARAGLDELEAFFSARSAPVVISLCPYADPSLMAVLARRSYRITHFENTLARELRAEDWVTMPSGVRPATPLDAVHWSKMVTEGFSDTGESDPATAELFQCLFAAGGATPYYAYSEGEPGGGGVVGIWGGAAMLYGDSTLTRFRGRGLQSALIRARLRKALDAGCGWAFACTMPGSISQRNYERAGFQVAYTKTMLVKDWT